MKNITIIITSCILLFAPALKAQEVIPTKTLTPKTDTLLKVKELGIGFSNLNSFSLQYRWGTDNMLFSISGSIAGSTSFGSGTNGSTQVRDTMSSYNSSTTSKTSTPINFSTGLSFSALHIKYITKKFGIMHGGILGCSYAIANNQTNSTGTNVNYQYHNTAQTGTFPISGTTNNHSQTIQPYIGLVFGAVYKINKSFLVYVSIAPNFYYAHTNSTTNTTYNSNLPYTYYTTNNYNSSSTNNTFGLASLSNSGATITIVYRIPKVAKAITKS
ncbi:MAG TPA: hypothetical protein VF411_09015 [Bacteroidia bacterium]